MGRGWVEGGYTTIGQPPQTDRIYNYKDKIKLYNFHPFLLFLRSFHVRYFIDCSNIFDNAFYCSMCSFLFCWNNGIVLDSSVRSRERTIVPWERRQVLRKHILLYNLGWRLATAQEKTIWVRDGASAIGFSVSPIQSH